MTGRGLLPSTRLAVQVAAAVLLSIVIVNVIALERPFWVILTAIVVMVGTVGETLTKSMDRVAGTLVGLVTGVVIYWAAARADLPGVVPLLISGPAIVFFRFASYRLMIIALTVLLVCLFRIGGTSDALLVARLVDTAIGAAISAVVSIAVLPIPTRGPATETVHTYVAALKTIVQESLQAVAQEKWSSAIDARADAIRSSEADLQRLAEALRAESALIGGSGALARGALTVLPALRGHVDSLVQACEPAASRGPGSDLAEQLTDIARLIAENFDRVEKSLVSRQTDAIPRLDDPTRRIEELLAPKLSGTQGARDDVMVMLNVVLAARRLNRGLRHAMEVMDRS